MDSTLFLCDSKLSDSLSIYFDHATNDHDLENGNWQEQHLFKGKVLHSVDYTSAKNYGGTKGIIIGTANTGKRILSPINIEWT